MHRSVKANIYAIPTACTVVSISANISQMGRRAIIHRLRLINVKILNLQSVSAYHGANSVH